LPRKIEWDTICIDLIIKQDTYKTFAMHTVKGPAPIGLINLISIRIAAPNCVYPYLQTTEIRNTGYVRN
jgi:hypothetical protein